MKATARRLWVTIAAVLLTAGLAAGGPISETDPDLYDLWQNATVLDYSPLYNGGEGISDARDMFGGEYSYLAEPGRTLFADGQPQGTIHWIRWLTSGPITFNHISLLAGGDFRPSNGRPYDPVWRSITHFALKRGSGQLIYETDITQPNDGWVELSVTLPTFITEQEFRAEFTQGWGQFPSGPRIVELDAVHLPEPSTVTLFGLGIAALIWTRRSKAK